LATLWMGPWPEFDDDPHGGPSRKHPMRG